MKVIKISFWIILFIVVSYCLGPTMPKPVFDEKLPSITVGVGHFVDSLEASEMVLTGNEAKIIWANDSLQNTTEFVLLYLHGFSASRREGFPATSDFQKRYGCNAYLSRLASHGLKTDNPLIDMTPERLYESAKQALVIARQLGRKVIIMGTSTGGSLGLMLASDFPDMVYGLILYSPNIRIKQNASLLLAKPWGLQIARSNFGGDFRTLDYDPTGEYCRYWYCRYRAEGTVYLQQLIDAKMKKDLFSKVKCPVFMGYYYKDKEHQDQIISVKAALTMFDQLGTPASQKASKAFSNAGAHVIECDLTSNCVNEVEEATWDFTDKILNLHVK